MRVGSFRFQQKFNANAAIRMARSFISKESYAAVATTANCNNFLLFCMSLPHKEFRKVVATAKKVAANIFRNFIAILCAATANSSLS